MRIILAIIAFIMLATPSWGQVKDDWEYYWHFGDFNYTPTKRDDFEKVFCENTEYYLFWLNTTFNSYMANGHRKIDNTVRVQTYFDAAERISKIMVEQAEVYQKICKN